VALWVAPAAAFAVAWVWFLALGKAPGGVKRLAFRVTLLALLGGLLAAGVRRGVFARTSPGFQLVLLVALIGVELGYLYTTRFCPRCGRMVRNLRPAACPRCAALLPRHGMTSALRTAGPLSGGNGEDRDAPPRIRRP
jgi:hypothetical protein